MKKNFPMLLGKIAGAIVLLSIAAFVLMTIVKLLVMTLVVAGIGGLLFKMFAKKRQQLLGYEYMSLPVSPQKTFAKNKIQPIYQSTNKNKTIIPIL